MRADQSAAYAI
jgi:hypothetical protein